MPDLEDAIVEALEKSGWQSETELREAGVEETPEEEGDLDGLLQLAIVGRPNVGKSTLVNALVGDERVITGPQPGITRDAISIEWMWNDLPIKLIDTAGMRRKARVNEKVEKLSVGDTLEAIRFAHVVVLVLDATMMPEKQDLVIARHIIDEGRAIVIAVNKWDAVEDRQEALDLLYDRMEISLPRFEGAGREAVSADVTRYTETIAGSGHGLRDLEQAHLNRAAEPLAAAGGRTSSAPDQPGTAYPYQVYHPVEGQTADLRGFRQPTDRRAGPMSGIL